MASEILPNLSSTIVVFAPLIVANAILLEAALSYLGAGVQAPSSSWGTMIADGTRLMPGAIHLVLVPGVMLVLDRALGERVRRRGARRPRPEGLAAGAALMATVAVVAPTSAPSSSRGRSWIVRFLARRLASLVAVLFAITVLTFLIFQAIPSGDPALRMAGRLATPQQVRDVRVQWGFDKPIYVQYAKTMEKVLDGSVISYSQQINVRAGNRQGPAAHDLAGARRRASSGWWSGSCSGCSAPFTREACSTAR